MNFFKWILHKPAFFWFVICTIPFYGFSQTFIDQEEQLFTEQTIRVDGKIGHLTLEQIGEATKKTVSVLIRQGSYPQWTTKVALFQDHGHKLKKHSEILLDSNVLYYGFTRISETDFVVLVLPDKIKAGIYKKNQWQWPKELELELMSFIEPYKGSGAIPMVMRPDQASKDEVWIPTLAGFVILELTQNAIQEKFRLPIAPKSFYRNGHNLHAFDLPYWFHHSFWYPNIFIDGSLDTSKRYLVPWMDEVEIYQTHPRKPLVQSTKYFNILTEKQREDRRHYVINEPIDLNGDGQMDFLMNQFQGTGTQFQAQTHYFIAGKDGTLPSKAKTVPGSTKGTSGAVVRDINRNGKQDMILASSQFSVWAMIRALTKRQVLISFNIHLFDPQKNDYDFSKANATRDVMFDFSLSDFFIDGILPTMDGDFNGDGYPDVMYARNPSELTILLQKPNTKELYSSVPSGLYKTKVRKEYRIGDVTGNQKSDLIFFDTQAQPNTSFTYLINQAVVK